MASWDVSDACTEGRQGGRSGIQVGTQAEGGRWTNDGGDLNETAAKAQAEGPESVHRDSTDSGRQL